MRRTAQTGAAHFVQNSWIEFKGQVLSQRRNRVKSGILALSASQLKETRHALGKRTT